MNRLFPIQLFHVSKSLGGFTPSAAGGSVRSGQGPRQKRRALSLAGPGSLALIAWMAGAVSLAADDADRPNILFAFADDWGVHSSIHGTPGIETPTFDRVAEAGVRFDRAFIDAPSCTPARGAVLTGQPIWRLGPGANLHSTLPAEIPVYPDLLEEAGYSVGYTRKGWAPGNVGAGGRERNPAGPSFDDFAAFLEERPEGAPFAFWFGSQDPHRSRGYSADLRREMGIDPDEVEVPPYLPDVDEVRRDIGNYFASVQRFDREVGELLDLLEAAGELENTVVVISSDHSWPFPRGKSNLYDAGTHIPLAIWWPERMSGDRGGRVVTDFVHASDLAATFLEAAGVRQPREMTARSLLPIMESEREGRVQGFRSYALLAKERHHGHARRDGSGYPIRGIRTEDFLYLRNFEPDRWPAGDPDVSSSQGIFSDTDAGPSKQYLIDHADDPDVQPLFLLSFGKRPAEELYDLRNDPYQMNNLAGDPAYRAVREHLAGILENELEALEDPRMLGTGDAFDRYPYHVGYGFEIVEPPEPVRRALELE